MLAWFHLPVSYLLAAWHEAAALLTGPASGLGWALAVVGLVVTVRAILLWPAVAQMRTGRAVARLQPELAALRERHRDDPMALARATTDLQRAHGVRPFATLGPLLLQIPIMLGAVGVLHGFVPGATSNGLFGAADVASFLHARLGGAGLVQTVLGGDVQGFAILGHWSFSPAVLAVAAPVALVAALATHLTARLARRRQAPDGSGLATAIGMWLIPVGTVLGALVLPLVTEVYVLAHSVWTLGQQYLVGRYLDAH
ncbi:membrane protein insertase YidC [Actinomycetospora endophytica]|uniref:Membrane protein insertase YidC n=1 Tax=Actinomycetospora endophytica TaxID=2291215 RepID=A0ABS8PEP0_9PSEU|nr:membrane protein insertase YidC [Actinomycetospora endophytica]MCD2195459.1 membrane protein insertase YidC [Actinomycetospora endophytica]